MKLIVLRSNLMEAFSSVERAIRDGVDLPILKSVYLKTEGNKILAVGTNLELAITHSFSGKVIESGEVVIPFFTLYSVVRNLNSERITIEEKNRKLIISTDNYEAFFQCQDTKEFPIIPSIHNTSESIKLDAKTLCELIGDVVVATQYSEIRPEISGVFIHNQNDENVVFVATDSFRLCEKKGNSTKLKSSFQNIKAIIPIKTAEDILKVFSNHGDEEVEIFIDQTQILFSSSSVRAVSRLIDGNFPEYNAIVPRQTKIEIPVPREEMIQAIRLTSSFSGRGNDIKIVAGENKKHLELSASDESLGGGAYKIPIKLKGEKFSILFNWRYLLDGMKLFKGEYVILGINESNKPIVLKSPQDPDLIYVIQPIKG